MSFLKLNYLELYNYKNILESKYSFDKPVNCFVGNNGVGKTNILEAVSYLTSGRGIRKAKSKDLIFKKFDDRFFWIILSVIKFEIL